MAMVLTACGSDDEILNDVQRGDRHPLQFTAAVEDIQTRVTSDNKWTDGDEIGVKISNDPNNTIGQYKLNADGTVQKVIKGVEWQGTESATVTAWYPYAESETTIDISNQQNGYTDYEILNAKEQGSSAAPVVLVFKHQMAKVRCRLKATYEGRDISINGAKVEFYGNTSVTVDNGTVKSSGTQGGILSYEDSENGVSTYTALLSPQTITADIGFIKVTIGSDISYYKPAQDVKLEAGKSYNYNIKIADVPDNTIDSKGTYHVYTADGLNAWVGAVEIAPETSCTLEANITMSGNWTPISSFKGTFDGNEHTISGLTVNLTDENYAGFIGRLDGGTVKNLTLENVNITGIDVTTGGVAGYCNGGTIENCHITGTGRISVTEDSYSGEIGGIVGSNSKGTILACHVSKEYSVGTDATMAQTFLTGGIAGKNSGGTIKGCYALCKLTGNYVGGICGSNSSSYDDTESSYIACYSNCSYNASGNAGGILGRSSGSPTFTQCYYQNGVGSGVGGESENKHGVEAMFNWTDQDYLRDNVTSNMNNTLGEDFGYKYIVNNPISQDEPLILVKKQ